MIKITKLTRLYRLIRLARMVRLLKMLHIENRYLKMISEIFKINPRSERLLMMTMILILLMHVVACLWVYAGKFDENSKDNWIYTKGFTDMNSIDLYITSFYFTVTTLMTVGYGDITANSSLEKLICVFLMLIGVIAFSYANNAISSIISNQDSAETKLRDKMETLQQLQEDYKIQSDLYDKIVKAMQYGHKSIRSTKSLVDFLEELPTKLKMDLALYIHEYQYGNIMFFKPQNPNFKSWIGTYLKPLNVQAGLLIY